MNTLVLALRGTLDEQALLLRAVAASAACSAAILAWRRPVPKIGTACISFVSAGFVLQQLFPAFLLVNAIAYSVVRVLQSSLMRWRKTVVCLLVLVGVFIIARHSRWDRPVVVIQNYSVQWFYLDMWMVLRLFVLFWEVGAGKQKSPDSLTFWGWAMSPLFLVGPLLRSSEWPAVLRPVESCLRDRQWWLGVLRGLLMATAGMTLVSILKTGSNGIGGKSLLEKLMAVFFLGPWGFYLTIAGTFRVLEELARLSGVTVAPSFDRPFLQSNIAEFWARWNTTATSVFREFFFYNRWGLRSFNPYVNIVIVFFAVGLWHGSNVYWIGFGLLHGLYFSVYLWLRSRLGRHVMPGKRLLGVVITYVAVCLSWYIPSKVAGLIQR